MSQPQQERVFHYRYVPYGTRFSPSEGDRRDDDNLDERHRLFENELAVDVGGVCWGYGGVSESVLDHHFLRDEGQFPSAAAAVLHNAARIEERFCARPGEIWLVSHIHPDFDAFCAMFLARQLIAGDLPGHGWQALGIQSDGWRVKRGADDCRPQIDWFQPNVAELPVDLRWAVLLAAYAACVDNCRRLACPKTRALHAVLYAALVRGRSYKSQTSGAVEFFAAVKHELQTKNLNPLYDSVLEGNHIFERELRMLDHELDAYHRDLRRARRAIVFVQQADRPPAAWADEVCQRPLLESQSGETFAVAPLHLEPAPSSLSPVDGIYLRDPECLLFKEWARYDVENSFFRQGFLFTAVAYSGGRSSRFNNTEYFFALDPERAQRRHLYNVWGRLQAAECGQLAALHPQVPDDLKDAQPRKGFEGRAGDHPAWFHDPWFDGSNYAFTLVATPNRGTYIGQPDGSPDLTDDPIVSIVRQELELPIFQSQVQGRELSSEPGDAHQDRRPFDIGQADKQPPHRERHYYYYEVVVSQEVALVNRQVAEQLGRVLWRVLEGEHGASVPADFTERHLLGGADWIGVWSRRGIALAHKPGASQRIEHLRELFSELVSLSREAGALSHAPTAEPSDELLAKGAHLTRRVADAKRRLAFPEARLLGRFFEASRLDEVLAAVHDLNLVSSEAAHRHKIEQLTHGSHHLQANVEWLEIFVVAFYVFEFFDMLAKLYDVQETATAAFSISAAFIAGLMGFWLLRPDRHSRFPAYKVVWLAIIGLIAASIFAGVVGLLPKKAANDRDTPPPSATAPEVA